MSDTELGIPIPRTSESLGLIRRESAVIQPMIPAGVGGTMLTTSVGVDDTPTPLPMEPQVNRKALAIENHGSEIVYIGGQTVSSVPGGGLLCLPGECRTFDYGPVAVYGVCATGKTSTVCVCEVS